MVKKCQLLQAFACNLSPVSPGFMQCGLQKILKTDCLTNSKLVCVVYQTVADLGERLKKEIKKFQFKAVDKNVFYITSLKKKP